MIFSYFCFMFVRQKIMLMKNLHVYLLVAFLGLGCGNHIKKQATLNNKEIKISANRQLSLEYNNIIFMVLGNGKINKSLLLNEGVDIPRENNVLFFDNKDGYHFEKLEGINLGKLNDSKVCFIKKTNENIIWKHPNLNILGDDVLKKVTASNIDNVSTNLKSLDKVYSWKRFICKFMLWGTISSACGVGSAYLFGGVHISAGLIFFAALIGYSLSLIYEFAYRFFKPDNIKKEITNTLVD